MACTERRQWWAHMWILHCDSHREFAESFATLMGARGHLVVARIALPAETAEVLRRDPEMARGIDVVVSEVDNNSEQLQSFRKSLPEVPLVLLTRTDSAVAFRDLDVDGVALKLDSLDEIERVLTAVISRELHPVGPVYSRRAQQLMADRS